jgi:DNA end-binding protein Ku
MRAEALQLTRAMWKAAVEFGDVRVPVKLYAAVESRDVHFRLLHAKDRAPVKQRMVDPRSQREVPPEAVRRGLAIEPGLFVVLQEAELEQLRVESSRSIEITSFVPAAAIDQAWYSRPYLLGPDTSAPEFAALHAALHASGLHGIARWAMRGKRYFGALAARDSQLSLIALRAAEEVVAASALEAPATGAVSAAERSLAKQLVAALDAKFEPEALRDDYRERVLAFIEAKAQGKHLELVRETAPSADASDLARTLKRSLQAVKNKRRAA